MVMFQNESQHDKRLIKQSEIKGSENQRITDPLINVMDREWLGSSDPREK